MGKRSDFPRIDKDFYRTIDLRAVAALVPHLGSVQTFSEPCCGEGDLIGQLEHYGLVCVQSSDLAEGVNALSLTTQDLNSADCIITNPPWSRHLLHPMIEHFSRLAPTWLLFDADWSHTGQSSRYMRDLCTDVVSVGRLIWIEGTKTQGKDNAAWYRFDTNKSEPTRFHGRQEKQ